MSALCFLWLSHWRFSPLYCLHHTPTQYTFGVRQFNLNGPLLLPSLLSTNQWEATLPSFNQREATLPTLNQWEATLPSFNQSYPTLHQSMRSYLTHFQLMRSYLTHLQPMRSYLTLLQPMTSYLTHLQPMRSYLTLLSNADYSFNIILRSDIFPAVPLSENKSGYMLERTEPFQGAYRELKDPLAEKVQSVRY